MTTEAVSVRAISLELLLSILKEGEYSHLLCRIGEIPISFQTGKGVSNASDARRIGTAD